MYTCTLAADSLGCPTYIPLLLLLLLQVEHFSRYGVPLDSDDEDEMPGASGSGGCCCSPRDF
jgi:hypothetical protein